MNIMGDLWSYKMSSENIHNSLLPSLQIENDERGVGSASGTFVVAAEYLNRQGILHGGITAGLMDGIMGRAASCHLGTDQRRWPVTLSLSLNFVGTAGMGILRLQAKTTGGGKQTCFCDGRIEDSDGNLIATAQGAFKLLERKLSGG
jgi:uncharacterized protein (TIGR00369 family)